MAIVTQTYHDKIAILRMANGATNPISPDLIDEMADALAEIKDKARGLILCGGEKFFCIGFDLPHLLKLDRSAMSDFLLKFNELTASLFMLPMPLVCALSGHAVAGGCILALTGDYRVASTEKKKIGLNEIKLGVPVPHLADMMLRHIVGQRHADRMMLEGAYLSFKQAEEIGLIDEIISTDNIEQHAMEKIADAASHPSQAFAAIKASKVEQTRARYEKNRETSIRVFLDCWFSETTQTLLNEASRNF